MLRIAAASPATARSSRSTVPSRPLTDRAVFPCSRFAVHSRRMHDSSPRAQFEITINGVSRTWRDAKDSALDAARNLKGRNIGSDVKVTDHRDGSAVEITS